MNNSSDLLMVYKQGDMDSWGWSTVFLFPQNISSVLLNGLYSYTVSTHVFKAEHKPVCYVVSSNLGQTVQVWLGKFLSVTLYKKHQTKHLLLNVSLNMTSSNGVRRKLNGKVCCALIWPFVMLNIQMQYVHFYFYFFTFYFFNWADFICRESWGNHK